MKRLLFAVFPAARKNGVRSFPPSGCEKTVLSFRRLSGCHFFDRLSDLPMLKDTFLRLSEAPEMKCAVPVFPSSQYDHNLPLLRYPPFRWSFQRFKQFLRA